MSLRFKRHYKLLVLLVLLSVVLLAGWGDQRIVAYTIESGGPEMAQVVHAGSANAILEPGFDSVLLPILDTGN